VKRKQFTDEQIIWILREAEREDKTVAHVCRAHGVPENSYYRWRRESGG
jgi:putative transposase